MGAAAVEVEMDEAVEVEAAVVVEEAVVGYSPQLHSRSRTTL